jgi:putative acetyltransferase
MTLVRWERQADRAAVFNINARAFGSPDEARLVDALRQSARPQISLVALREGRVTGHIFFSPVTVGSGPGAWEAIGLAPMAVEPEWQKQGIGSELVRAGLAACQSIRRPVVFVLGHPEYYPRFGFRPAPPLGLHFRGAEYDPAFMVAELETGCLAGRTGEVRYLPDFDRFG